MASQETTQEKLSTTYEQSEQEVPVERIATIEVDNFEGLTVKCVVVYLAILAVGFAEMMVIVSSGLLTRSMVADIGGTEKTMWMSQTVPIVNLALGAPVSQASDYWGRKWFLVISCVFALVGSTVVSRATTMDMALAGNVLASISTCAQPLLYAIASEILPRRWRPAAQGGVTGIFAIAAVVALLMGSALTKHNPAGWRIVWYFNIACFAFTGVVITLLYNPLPRPEQLRYTWRQKMQKLDWVGIFLLAVGVALLCVGLTWSQNPFPWKNPHVVVPFTLGCVLLICLGLYETIVKKDGLFHHGLFTHDRNYAISCFLIFTEGMAFFIANAYLPLENSVLFETDVFLVGVNFTIVFISAIVGTGIASLYCSWSRQLRWPLVVSYMGFVLFYATMMTVGFGSKKAIWGFPVFLGLGFGGCLTCVVVAAHFSAPPALLALSSGGLITARSSGAAICFAIGNAIFNSQITKNLPKDIAAAVLPLGLSPQSIGPFVVALAGQNNAALATIEGVTPEIIGAGVHGLQQAYITSLKPLHAFGLALSILAVIASAFLKDPKEDFTMHVDAPLDTPKVPQVEEVEQAKS